MFESQKVCNMPELTYNNISGLTNIIFNTLFDKINFTFLIEIQLPVLP